MQRRKFIQLAAAAASAGVIAQVRAGNAQQLAWQANPAGCSVSRRRTDRHRGAAFRADARRCAQINGLVDNRGGAGGSLGADSVAKSAPDGQTLLMATVGTHAINPALYRKLPYDPLRDFTPIAMVAMAPVAIVVNPAQPIGSLAELVALARKMPGKLNYGSAASALRVI
jgi:hypothetical protein